MNLTTFQPFNFSTNKALLKRVSILTILFVACNGRIYAQATKTLNQPNTTGTHTATQSITLAPGFTSTGPFHAYITGAATNCVSVLHAPSGSQNYVLTTTMRVPGITSISGKTACEVNQVIQYFDGLGRPLQTVGIQASATGQDVIQPFVYDTYGREDKKYLPYTATSNGGAYRSSPLTAQAAFYNTPPAGVVEIDPVNSITHSFSQARFETSPLNRVIEQGAPGAVWQPYDAAVSGSGHTVKTVYGSNVANEVKLWIVGSGSASTSDSYGAGQLYKTTKRDENWTSGNAGTTEEFKDKEGRVVLKRVWKTDTHSLSTYYVYDDIGNLRYVLPPAINENNLALTSFTDGDTNFNNFIYAYRYDGRNRLAEKKIPGKGWEYLVYNKLDQVILTQDAVQRNSNQWTFTKYNAHGQIAITGLFTDGTNTTRSNQQSLADAETDLWETFTGSGTTGYTSDAYPASTSVYLTINWYGTYGFPGNSSVASSGITASTKIQGLLTGMSVYETDGTDPLLTATYYDDEGRVLQTMAQNHLGGTDRVTNTWSFADELTASTRVHIANSTTTSIANRWEYDQTGRKLNAYQQINSNPEVQVSGITYNETEQLWKKGLHNNLELSTNTYNERGWLRTSGSGLFSMELKYELGTYPQYNGNISNQLYTNGGSLTTFTYEYDKLNRLTSGAATGMTEELTYDDMGNITSLNRNSLGTSTYSYSGNQLTTISGASVNTGGNNYLYDANGNAKTDARNNKTITYNLLNLPATVSGGLSYTYDATGAKLTKNNNGTLRHYIDGIEYNGSVIELIHSEEGIARRSGSNYVYEYNLKDHLGNTRVTFLRDPVSGLADDLQRDDYYPFGKRNNTLLGGNDNKYLYNGKELQDELGQYDYGARFYDAEIGRWQAPDLLSEKHSSITPYNYVLNNPLYYVDPFGLDTIPARNLDMRTYKHNDVVALDEVNITSSRISYTPEYFNFYQSHYYGRPTFNYKKAQDVIGISDLAISTGIVLSDIESGRYPTTKGGYKYLSDYSKFSKMSKQAQSYANFYGGIKFLGKSLVVSGIAIDIKMTIDGDQSIEKTGLNLGVTSYGFFVGGPPGWVVGSTYFIIDNTIGWNNATKSYIQTHKEYKQATGEDLVPLMFKY